MKPKCSLRQAYITRSKLKQITTDTVKMDYRFITLSFFLLFSYDNHWLLVSSRTRQFYTQFLPILQTHFIHHHAVSRLYVHTHRFPFPFFFLPYTVPLQYGFNSCRFYSQSFSVGKIHQCNCSHLFSCAGNTRIIRQ